MDFMGCFIFYELVFICKRVFVLFLFREFIFIIFRIGLIDVYEIYGSIYLFYFYFFSCNSFYSYFLS